MTMLKMKLNQHERSEWTRLAEYCRQHGRADVANHIAALVQRGELWLNEFDHIASMYRGWLVFGELPKNCLECGDVVTERGHKCESESGVSEPVCLQTCQHVDFDEDQNGHMKCRACGLEADTDPETGEVIAS